MSKLDRSLTFLIIGLIAFAPSHAAQWIGPRSPDGPIAARDLELRLTETPLAPDENIKATSLARTEHSENFLVQIRDREPLHYHTDSDLTVWIVRGQGTMHIEDKSYSVQAGDTVHIPRGTQHQYINRGPIPSAALVVFSPPPGPEDRVLVTPKK